MAPPWHGEKVNLFIRLLAIVFILCALIAFRSLVEHRDDIFIDADWRDYIGLMFAPYVFLLFLKVAVTGYAPKTWLPWK
ncbi:hypothetical protein [Thalassotalea marina]|uniref:Uncharacterized protein n=1 Tax=Thalassotalea marina TaxID=1673741 RepID=A0A919BKA9_9GAMM|nr:hypothetical protein [Thalassotalea marina]GHF94463.1 hypothetical protein GCM10017161_23390 [Thalassotalea marina]